MTPTASSSHFVARRRGRRHLRRRSHHPPRTQAFAPGRHAHASAPPRHAWPPAARGSVAGRAADWRNCSIDVGKKSSGNESAIERSDIEAPICGLMESVPTARPVVVGWVGPTHGITKPLRPVFRPVFRIQPRTILRNSGPLRAALDRSARWLSWVDQDAGTVPGQEITPETEANHARSSDRCTCVDLASLVYGSHEASAYRLCR